MENQNLKLKKYKISIQIKKCTKKNIGNYKVLVKNSEGEASSNAQLTIKGKKTFTE